MKRRTPPSQKGQISLLMAMMVVSFLFFFQFVVNTGILVNAKINLQNAADLAAYSGASVQARLLNSVSFLNYEMRRQYKKFLFRYYVLGNLSQKGFPNSGSEIYNFSPDGVTPFGVPAVCVIFDKNDNYCQVRVNPAIQNVDVNPLDPLSGSLNQTLGLIENIRQSQCLKIGQMNGILLSLWLYNADPGLKVIESALTNDALLSTANSDVLDSLRSVRGLAEGLGLFPKEFLLLLRIKTLEFYLNFPAQIGVDIASVSDLEAGGDPVARERPVLAFKSAFNTLGEHVFDASTIRMTELLPPGPDGALTARFDPINADFETYFASLEPNSALGGACESRPSPIPVRNMPLGVTKDPNVLTYYAIRLEAEAKSPFSPFGPVRLKAYSAAQPFGSRVGPSLERLESAGPGSGFTAINKKPSGNLAIATEVNGIPNLPVSQNDTTAQGWMRTQVLQAMRAQMGGGGTLTPSDYLAGYQAAMAPNPPEKGLYNILNDFGDSPDDPLHLEGGDPFHRYFDEDMIHTVWAPLVSADQVSGGLTQEIQQAILSTAQIEASIKNAMADSISIYVQEIAAAPGDQGERLNTIPLRNPFKALPESGSTGLLGLDPSLMLKTAEGTNTSWAELKDDALAKRGRMGYSVKFVAFSTLLNPGATTTDGSDGAWSNLPELDAEALQDIGEAGSQIKH